MKEHTYWYPDEDSDAICRACGADWPCDKVEYRQSKCGCQQSMKPKRRPWYYKRGDWTSWKPFSVGGDEWCRWTLVVGVGPVTGVLVIPLWECRGCEDCGPHVVDGVYKPLR